MELLEKVMVEHGIVIRAIPYEHSGTLEVRHKDKYPNGIVCYDEKHGRNMLKITEKNSKGGKFIITTAGWQGTYINWGKPVIFYDTLEQAINSIVKVNLQTEHKLITSDVPANDKDNTKKIPPIEGGLRR